MPFERFFRRLVEKRRAMVVEPAALESRGDGFHRLRVKLRMSPLSWVKVNAEYGDLYDVGTNFSGGEGVKAWPASAADKSGAANLLGQPIMIEFSAAAKPTRLRLLERAQTYLNSQKK